MWIDWLNEVALTLVILGLLFIAFSKVRGEDELTGRIRMYALYWAVFANSAIFILIAAFVLFCKAFGINVGDAHIFIIPLGPLSYIYYFSVYNLFTPLVVFIVIFYVLLFSNKNEFLIGPMRYLPNRPYNILGKWLTIMMMGLVLIGIKYQPLQSVLFFLPLPALIWAYSKEKNEDEFIELLRLEAMQIAVYINYAITLVANFSLYDGQFLSFQTINIVTLPIIFMGWFHYKLYRAKQQTKFKQHAL